MMKTGWFANVLNRLQVDDSGSEIPVRWVQGYASPGVMVQARSEY